MEAHEAVERAKRYVTEMFDAEPIREVGLEEVERQGCAWLVTIACLDERPNVAERVHAPPRWSLTCCASASKVMWECDLD